MHLRTHLTFSIDWTFVTILIKIKKLFHKNASENIVYKMVAILSMGRWINYTNLIVVFHKNIERHTAHTIVSWPNPKQWVIVHVRYLLSFSLMYPNSMAMRRCCCNLKLIIFTYQGWISCAFPVSLHLNATRPCWWLVNIACGNGLVPSDSRPLHEPMYTQIYVTI